MEKPKPIKVIQFVLQAEIYKNPYSKDDISNWIDVWNDINRDALRLSVVKTIEK